jgi:hypothetical protein
MAKKTITCTMLISLTIIVGLSSGIMTVSAHSPRYIDLNYYAEEEVLSAYFTHGVSDSDSHYVFRVIVEFYELDEALLEAITSDDPENPYILKARDEADQEAENEKFGYYAIQQTDVFTEGHTIKLAKAHWLASHNSTIAATYNYTSQEEHQIFHHNYTLDIPEWTLIAVTALCSNGGFYTKTLISGHPWYDIEHHITEAIVPTIICSIIVMTPLAIFRIFGEKKKEVTH